MKNMIQYSSRDGFSYENMLDVKAIFHKKGEKNLREICSILARV